MHMHSYCSSQCPSVKLSALLLHCQMALFQRQIQNTSKTNADNTVAVSYIEIKQYAYQYSRELSCFLFWICFSLKKFFYIDSWTIVNLFICPAL